MIKKNYGKKSFDLMDVQCSPIDMVKFSIMRSIVFTRVFPPINPDLDLVNTAESKDIINVFSFIRTQKIYTERKQVNQNLIDKIIENFAGMSLDFDTVSKVNREFPDFHENSEPTNPWYWPFGVFKYSTYSSKIKENSKVNLAGIWLSGHDFYKTVWGIKS